MFSILLLILLAMLFLLAELVLLPGVTVAALLAIVAAGGAIYLAFTGYGAVAGCVVIGVIILLAVLVVIFSLRAKTWQRFALKERLEESVAQPLAERVRLGSRGYALSRLSPIGRVEIAGESFEAKLQSGYALPRTEVEVVGYENDHLVVKVIQ